MMFFYQTNEVGNPKRQEEQPKCEIKLEKLRWVPQNPRLTPQSQRIWSSKQLALGSTYITIGTSK